MRRRATASTAHPDGQLWVGDGHVVDTNINIGSLQTKGYDFNVNYTGLEMGRFGSLNFNLTGTLLDELITEPGPGIDPFDCAGFYSYASATRRRSPSGVTGSARAGRPRGTSTCR